MSWFSGRRCFPTDEQPEFKWRAEAEMAAAVLCPLHGLRFCIVVKRDLYRAFRFYITDYKDGWPHQSAQYCRFSPLDYSLSPLSLARLHPRQISLHAA